MPFQWKKKESPSELPVQNSESTEPGMWKNKDNSNEMWKQKEDPTESEKSESGMQENMSEANTESRTVWQWKKKDTSNDAVVSNSDSVETEVTGEVPPQLQPSLDTQSWKPKVSTLPGLGSEDESKQVDGRKPPPPPPLPSPPPPAPLEDDGDADLPQRVGLDALEADARGRLKESLSKATLNEMNPKVLTRLGSHEPALQHQVLNRFFSDNMLAGTIKNPTGWLVSVMKHVLPLRPHPEQLQGKGKGKGYKGEEKEQNDQEEEQDANEENQNSWWQRKNARGSSHSKDSTEEALAPKVACVLQIAAKILKKSGNNNTMVAATFGTLLYKQHGQAREWVSGMGGMSNFCKATNGILVFQTSEVAGRDELILKKPNKVPQDAQDGATWDEGWDEGWDATGVTGWDKDQSWDDWDSKKDKETTTKESWQKTSSKLSPKLAVVVEAAIELLKKTKHNTTVAARFGPMLYRHCSTAKEVVYEVGGISKLCERSNGVLVFRTGDVMGRDEIQLGQEENNDWDEEWDDDWDGWDEDEYEEEWNNSKNNKHAKEWSNKDSSKSSQVVEVTRAAVDLLKRNNKTRMVAATFGELLYKERYDFRSIINGCGGMAHFCDATGGALKFVFRTGDVMGRDEIQLAEQNDDDDWEEDEWEDDWDDGWDEDEYQEQWNDSKNKNAKECSKKDSWKSSQVAEVTQAAVDLLQKHSKTRMVAATFGELLYKQRADFRSIVNGCGGMGHFCEGTGGALKFVKGEVAGRDEICIDNVPDSSWKENSKERKEEAWTKDEHWEQNWEKKQDSKDSWKDYSTNDSWKDWKSSQDNSWKDNSTWKDNSWKDYDDENSTDKFKIYPDQIKVKKKSPEVTLLLQNLNVTDKRLRSCFDDKLRRLLLQKAKDSHPDANEYFFNVDLSNNDLGPDGVHVLVSFLRQLQSSSLFLAKLKVYKNRLGDEGAKHLAKYIYEQPSPLHEIHLSHNGIGATGATSLALAVMHNRHSVYPFRRGDKTEYLPCWCRLESNNVKAPTNLVEALKRIENARLVKTTRSMKEWGPTWTPSEYQGMNDFPQIVLHLFDEQGGKGKGFEKGHIDYDDLVQQEKCDLMNEKYEKYESSGTEDAWKKYADKKESKEAYLKSEKEVAASEGDTSRNWSKAAQPCEEPDASLKDTSIATKGATNKTSNDTSKKNESKPGKKDQQERVNSSRKNKDQKKQEQLKAKEQALHDMEAASHECKLAIQFVDQFSSYLGDGRFNLWTSHLLKSQVPAQKAMKLHNMMRRLMFASFFSATKEQEDNGLYTHYSEYQAPESTSQHGSVPDDPEYLKKMLAERLAASISMQKELASRQSLSNLSASAPDFNPTADPGDAFEGMHQQMHDWSMPSMPGMPNWQALAATGQFPLNASGAAASGSAQMPVMPSKNWWTTGASQGPPLQLCSEMPVGPFAGLPRLMQHQMLWPGISMSSINPKSETPTTPSAPAKPEMNLRAPGSQKTMPKAHGMQGQIEKGQHKSQMSDQSLQDRGKGKSGMKSKDGDQHATIQHVGMQNNPGDAKDKGKRKVKANLPTPTVVSPIIVRTSFAPKASAPTAAPVPTPAASAPPADKSACNKIKTGSNKIKHVVATTPSPASADPPAPVKTESPAMQQKTNKMNKIA